MLILCGEPLVVETAEEPLWSVVTSGPSAVVAKPYLPSAVAVSRWTWQQKTSHPASKSVSDQSSATVRCDVLSLTSDTLVSQWL